MSEPRARSMSLLLRELHACSEQQEREITMLRATVERLRAEREELLDQVRFTTEQANRETRAAGNLRVELLARTSVPKGRLDFCCDSEHGETTAVLPLPRAVRRQVRDDDTEPGLRG